MQIMRSTYGGQNNGAKWKMVVWAVQNLCFDLSVLSWPSFWHLGTISCRLAF